MVKIYFKSSRIEFTFIVYFAQMKPSALIRKLLKILIKQAIYKEGYITLRKLS